MRGNIRRKEFTYHCLQRLSIQLGAGIGAARINGQALTAGVKADDNEQRSWHVVNCAAAIASDRRQ